MAKVKLGNGETGEVNVGDTVKYVLPDGPNEGQDRVAEVTELKGDAGMCDLVVALTEDGDDPGQDVVVVNKRWKKWKVWNVDYNANGAQRTWHF